MIIAMVNDRSFAQKIEEAAAREGSVCLFLGDEETLWAALSEGTPDVLLIDIGITAFDGPELIQKLKQNPATRNIPIVAFGTSLRADLLQDARELGADKILAKSAFREQITGLIRHYCGNSKG